MAGRTSRNLTLDGLALLSLTLAPVLFALPRLGFYSDDYSILLRIHELQDQSWDPLTAEQMRRFYTRPGHWIYSALLYKAFGLHPLPYVIAQTLLMVASVLVLWLLLRRLVSNGTLAFTAAAVFAVLPQLSTIRIWFAAATVVGGLFFFLLGALLLLQWLRSGRTRWGLGSLLAWAVSLSFYELFIPLMLGLLGYAAWYRKSTNGGLSWFLALRPQLPHALLIGGVLLAKALMTDRADGWHPKYIVYQGIRLDYDPLTEDGFNARAALVMNFWETFARPLASIGVYLSDHLAIPLLLAVLGGGLVFARLYKRPFDVEVSDTWKAAVAGLVIFALGYAIFLLAPAVNFSPAGIGNRTSAAAAIGVAVVTAAALLRIALAAPVNFRRSVAAGIVALVCVLLSMRTAQIAEHWTVAYDRQQRILNAARVDLARVPAGSTVFLDGLCPYHGPAIVFETDWDVAGALSLLLRRDISGNIVGPGTKFGPAGISATLYGESHRFNYDYGATTFVYDPGRRVLRRLSNPEEASTYFSQRQPPDCPLGYAGHGVPI